MESTSLINIFDTCFKVCFAFTVLFLIISVILFFLFDIRAIFSIRTGRAKSKTVKEMENSNNTTGRLRVGGKTQTSKLSEADRRKTRGPVVVPPSSSVSGCAPNMEIQDSDYGATEVLPTDNNQTELLSDDGGDKTSRLSVENTEDFGETSVLSQKDQETININFQVVKKIILIHTEEVIN